MTDIPPYKEKPSPEAIAAREKWRKEKEANKDTIVYPGYFDFVALDNYGKPEEPFKPAKVAQWLAEHDHFKADEKTDMLYFGDVKSGKWTKEGETKLKKIVSSILGEYDKECHYRNILHTLRSLSYSEIGFSRKIACENGLLDVENLALTPFNLEEMAFHQIPVKYDKEAKKLEHWLEFLKQVANPNDIPLLQEWFGYCFLPDYRFHYALWIHGEGRNGKGVFDRTIKGLLGIDNFSTVGLERLDGTQRFVLKDLYGKLYNSCSEPVSNKIFQTEIFQKITGQDAIDAEFKNANKEKRYVNAAKITIIGNKFPKINQPTTAFKDRMIFVKFSKHFDSKEQIQNLENIWLSDDEQRSSILNWALEGLQRLLNQRYFSLTKTQQETEIMFNRVTDNITAFQMEIGVFDKNLSTTRADALLAYQTYCESIGVEPRKPSQFTQGMLRLSPKVKDGWVNKPKKERVWLGFGLKTQEQQNLELLPQLPQLQHQNILSIFSNSENIKDKNSVPTVVSVPLNPEVHKDRFCAVECESFQKPECPFFFNKLDQNSELPLKCYGFRAPNPGESS